MRKTPIQIHRIYEDYKNGFITGATGIPEIALIDMKEPEYLEWFNKGYLDGQSAFMNAMKKTYVTLKDEYESES